MGREPVKLLWTGGWDSTFRLLDLVLNQQRQVEPYYILFRDYTSTPIELATMDKIRAAVAERSAAAGALMLPTQLFEQDKIQTFPDITMAYRRLRAKAPIGYQYEYLASLIEQHNLTALEMTIHVDDRAFAHISNSVRQDGDAVVLAEHAETTDLQIFKGFRFPVLNRTKKQMEADARAHGFHDIMMMTWFCFKPDRKLRPCGCCNPCTFAIREGMGHRIPWQGYVRRYGWFVWQEQLDRYGRAVGRRIRKVFAGSQQA